MRNFSVVLLIALCVASFAGKASAEWSGPESVVSGKWGDGPNDFGFVSSDSAEGFPEKFFVDESNSIVISDQYNKRIKIYKNGATISCFGPKSIDLGKHRSVWPRDNFGVIDGVIVADGYGKVQVYSYDGSLYSEFYYPEFNFYGLSVDGNIIMYSSAGKIFKKYSVDSEFIDEYKNMGSAKGSNYSEIYRYGKRFLCFNKNGIEATIAYSKHNLGSALDNQGNIYLYSYAIDHDRTGDVPITVWYVDKFDAHGNELSHFVMPSSRYEPIPENEEDSPGHKQKVIEEFGSPVIAPDGSIYCWKRTPSTYSILKWTWLENSAGSQGAPNAHQ